MTRDETVREYTKEWDSVEIRRRQREILTRETDRAMNELMARHDAGEKLTDEEARQLTTYVCGPGWEDR